MTVTLEIPLPYRELSPNRAYELHWSVRSRARLTYKTEIWANAHNAITQGLLPKLTGKVVIDQEWFLGPTKDKRYRPEDEDNARASLKGALDGLVQASLIAGDSTKFVGWGSFKMNRVKKAHQGRACVVLTIREAK